MQLISLLINFRTDLIGLNQIKTMYVVELKNNPSSFDRIPTPLY